MIDNITYVAGYWRVPNYKKHDDEYYNNSIIQTIQRLKDHNVIFFYIDDNILNIVKSIKQTNIIFIKINIIGLPTWDISEFYLKSCENQDNTHIIDKYGSNGQKGVIHYNREYLSGGPDVYRNVFTIWTSKLFLIQQIIEINPYNTNNFAWIDAGLGNRLGDFLDIQNYKDNYINCRISYFKYLSNTIYLMAGILISNKDTWLKIIPLFKEELELQKNSNYAHDEETILHLVYEKNPLLFNHIYIDKLSDETDSLDNLSNPFENHNKTNMNMRITPLVSVKKLFLCIGHPRCGTGYISHLLTKFGYNVGNECMQKHGISSWFMTSNLNHSSINYIHLIHSIRNPFNAIPSIILENKYDCNSYNFRRKQIMKLLNITIPLYKNDGDLLYDTELAIKTFIYWNKICELKKPTLVIKIEDAYHLLDGFNKTKIKENKINKINKKYNSTEIKLYDGKIRNKPIVDFNSISLDLKNKLKQFCKKYKYNYILEGKTVDYNKEQI